MKLNYYFDTDISLINASIVHVMKMCQAFAKNGCDVTLFCTGAPDEIDLDAVFRKYGINTPFEVKMAAIPPWIVKYGHRFAHWYGAWQKSKMEAEEGVIYARSMMSVFFLRNKMPYVFEAHVEPDFVNRRIEGSILRHRNCRGLVVISQALKKRYLEMFPFFPEEKITVLHDAADPDTSGSGKEAVLRGETNGIRIGYIGSLFPGKCMETILPLAKACPEHRFHIVGGTEYWVNYWKVNAQRQEISNIEFYGFVDNSNLGDYYRAFDICILPFSKNIYINKNKRVDIGRWTSPLKLFEAMAYGKPMIVSQLATIEEVLSDGEDCIMARPDDIEDWVKKLALLCADTQLQSKIGAAAKEKLMQEYTWQERARRAAALFGE